MRSCASASSRSSRCMYLCVVEMIACPNRRRAYSIPFSRQIFVPHSCRVRYSTRSFGRPMLSRSREYVRLRFVMRHGLPDGDRNTGPVTISARCDNTASADFRDRRLSGRALKPLQWSRNFQPVLNTGVAVDSHDGLLRQLLDVVAGDDASQYDDATEDITTDISNRMIVARTEPRFGGGTKTSIFD
jgi:hypothetical protein